MKESRRFELSLAEAGKALSLHVLREQGIAGLSFCDVEIVLKEGRVEKFFVTVSSGPSTEGAR